MPSLTVRLPPWGALSGRRETVREGALWAVTMIFRRKVLLKSGLYCLLAFVLSALIGNSFVPDVCTSQGYGYPLPVYIAWCECFINEQPPSIQYGYSAFDLSFWIVAWLLLSKILLIKSSQAAKADVPKNEE
jgi:hypothetical protein